MVADILLVVLVMCGLTLLAMVWRDEHANRKRLEGIAGQVEVLTREAMRQRSALERDEEFARQFLAQEKSRRRRHLRVAPGLLPLGAIAERWRVHSDRVILASVVTVGLLAIPPATPFPPDRPASPPMAAPAPPSSAAPPSPEAPAPSTPTPPVPSRPAPDGGVGAPPERRGTPVSRDELSRDERATPSPTDRCVRLWPTELDIDRCLERLSEAVPQVEPPMGVSGPLRREGRPVPAHHQR